MAKGQLNLSASTFPVFVETYNRACAEHKSVVLFRGFIILLEEARGLIEHLRPAYKS